MENHEGRNVVSYARFRRWVARSLVIGVVAGAALGASIVQGQYRSLLKSLACHHAEVEVVDALSGEPLPIIIEDTAPKDRHGLPRQERMVTMGVSGIDVHWLGTESTYRAHISSEGYERKEVILEDSFRKQVVKLARLQGAIRETR